MTYTKSQFSILLILRIVLGYHFLFEGIDKLFNSFWTSAVFLEQTNWFLSDFYHYLAGGELSIMIVEQLNIWGQIFIGLSLIIGLFSKIGAYSGALLLLIYYLAPPPFLEGFLFIDKNLIEMLAFLIIALFPTSNIVGLDLLLSKYRKIRNEQ